MKTQFHYSEEGARMWAEQELKLTRFGIVHWPQRGYDDVDRYTVREPFNPELHDWLVELGYAFTPHPAEWDDGDAENGPGSGGCDDWDQYEGPDEYIIIEPSGRVAHRAARDLELEAFIDANGPGWIAELTDEPARRTDRD
jgi:hypothetical protein